MPNPDNSRFTEPPRIVYDAEGFQINPKTGARVPNGGRVDPTNGETLAVPVDPDTGIALGYE